jgi:hypothetical protein
MSHRIGFRSLLLLLVASLSLSAAAATPPLTEADGPIGHWVAEHPSAGGIGSWWDFRAGGTFVVYQGAMVTSPITRSGDTITLPPATVNGTPANIKFRVEGDTLHLISPAGADVAYNRVGTAPSASDTLLGKWRPAPPQTPSNDPKTAALERSNANALYVFSADNTESVRIPFTAHRGTWDAKAHTFQLQGDAGVYRFHLSYGKLELGQPPDTKKIDTYIPDPILQ